jgi:hypothetical protein
MRACMWRFTVLALRTVLRLCAAKARLWLHYRGSTRCATHGDVQKSSSIALTDLCRHFTRHGVLRFRSSMNCPLPENSNPMRRSTVGYVH